MQLVDLSVELLRLVLDFAGQKAKLACTATGWTLHAALEALALQYVEDVERVHQPGPTYRMRLGVALSKHLWQRNGYAWEPSPVRCTCRLLEKLARRCHLYDVPAGERGLLTLAASGGRVYSTGHDGVIRSWDAEMRTCTMQMRCGKLMPRTYGMLMHAGVEALAVSGDRLVSVHRGDFDDFSGVRVWNVLTGDLEHIIEIDDAVATVAAAGMELFVLCDSESESGIHFLVFDLISGLSTRAAVMPWHKLGCPCWMVVSNATLFVSWNFDFDDDEVDEWDVDYSQLGTHVIPISSLQPSAFLPSETNTDGTLIGNSAMALSEDGRVLITSCSTSCSSRGTATVYTTWDVATLAKLKSWSSHQTVNLHLLLCGDSLYVGWESTAVSYIEVWDVRSSTLQRRLYCPGGRLLYSIQGLARVDGILFVAFDGGDIGQTVTGALKAFIA